MAMPTDIAIGLNDQVYIVDSGNNRVLCYSKEGEYLFTFGSPGEGEGQLLAPVGIATEAEGSVFVADRGNRRIQIFDENGKFLMTIPTRSGDQTATPVDVAVDRSGLIYVTITKPFHRVLVFGEGAGKGEVKSIWGKSGNNVGEFRFPATLAVGPDENIYIVDVFNSRIQVFKEVRAPARHDWLVGNYTRKSIQTKRYCDRTGRHGRGQRQLSRSGTAVRQQYTFRGRAWRER